MKRFLYFAIVLIGLNSGLSKADFADWARESAGMSGYRFYGSIRDTTFDVTIGGTPMV